MTMMWCRAVWLEGGSEMEDAVPYGWVDEEKNILYWPLKNHQRFLRCEPDPITWRQYELRFVKQKDESKKKCLLYTPTTDCSGEDEDEVKPAVRKRVKRSYDDFSSGYSSTETETSYPSPPSTRRPPASTSSSMIVVKPPITLTRTTLASASPASTSTASTTPQTIVSTPRTPPSNSTTPTSSSPVTNTMILKCSQYDNLMSALHKLQADVDDLKSKLESNTRATIVLSKQLINSASMNAPAEKLMKIDSLEEMRKDINPDQRESLLRRICSIGGHNHRQSISYAMKALLTESVQAQMNMRGHGAKAGFQHTDLFCVLKDAMMKRHHSGNVTERDIFLGVADHLKHAPQRLLIEQKNRRVANCD